MWVFLLALTTFAAPAALPGRRRRPSEHTPPRWLHPPHHGKEQSCLRLLALPGSEDASGTGTGRQSAAVCCVTGGDDALLRQQLLQLSPPATHSCGGGSGGAFSAAALLAEQTQGTAVKALALLPLHPYGQRQQQEWLLVSAGAKQSLIACRLRPQQQHQGCGGFQPQEQQQQQEQQQEYRQGKLLPLTCDELAVKEPAVELRCKKPVPGVSP